MLNVYDYVKKNHVVKIKMSLSKTIKDNVHYIQFQPCP